MRQLLAVTPVMLQLNGTALTNHQTLPWQAGLALHLRAVDTVDANFNPSGGSTYTNGSNPNNTRFTWDFGDSAAVTDPDYTSGVRYAHNILEGFNVAHIYDTPGTYPVTLTTTDQTGAVASMTINVQVSETTLGSSHSDVSTADGNIIYVDAVNGNDTWTGKAPARVGTTTDGPYKTFAKVIDFLQAGNPANVQIRFKRGQTFAVYQADYNNSTLSNNNLIIGAYGATNLALPILSCADTGLSSIIQTTANAGMQNWTIQDIAFSSSVATTDYKAYGDAVRIKGTDISLRDVTFGHHVNDIFITGTVQGLLISDSSDQGNWEGNYDIECIVPYNDVVVMGNSFTGASYNFGNPTGHQPFIRFESVTTTLNGRVLFTDNVVAPTQCNEAALAIRESVGSVVDIGYTSNPASSLSYASRVTTVTAGGLGIGGTSDKFSWLANTHAGDGTLVANVTSMTAGLSGAQAGVMFRDSANANSKFADVMVTPTGILFQYRTTNGGTASTPVTVTTSAKWVKLVRSGNNFTGYYSSNGTSWTQIGTTQSISMATDSAQVGLVVTSGVTGTNCAALFAGGTIDGFAVGPSTNMFMDYSNNTFRNFLVKIGYKGGNVPGYLQSWIVADSNSLINTGLAFSNSGIHVMVRNNIQNTDPTATTEYTNFLSNTSYASIVNSSGYGESDIQVLNNTQYTTRTGSSAGVLLGTIGSYWHDAVVVNNLVVAPNATSASFGKNLYDIPSTSEFARIDNNVWTNPAGNGSSKIISVNATTMTVATWNANYRRAINSAYATSADDDVAATITLDANYVPSGTAVNVGAPIVGVWADFYGNPRTGVSWTAGAVNTASLLPPTNLTATPTSSSQINLLWTDNSTNETGFEIDRATDAAFTLNLHTFTVGAGINLYSDQNLAASTTYYYRVRATNAWGDSTNTSTVGATTLISPPAPPSNLVATVVSSSQINLSWTDNSSNETGFEIDRATDSAFTLNLQTFTVGAGITTYPDMGLHSSTTYYYRVRATSSGSDSANSPFASATTLAPSYGIFASELDVGAATPVGSANQAGGLYTLQGGGADIWGTSDQFHFLYQPLTGDGQIIARVTSLTAIGSSYTKGGVMIRNSLDANAQSAYMDIQYPNSTFNNADFLYRATTGGTTAYSGSGSAAIATPYWVKLVRNGNAFSGYHSADGVTWTLSSKQTIAMGSNTYIGLAYTGKSTTTLGTATFDHVSVVVTPITPTALTATTVSPSQINLSWTEADASVSGCTVQRATDAAFTVNLQNFAVAAGVLTLNDTTSLSPNTTYYYRVYATNPLGNSTNSNVASATTWATLPIAPSGLSSTAISGTQLTLTWADNSTNETGFKIDRATSSDFVQNLTTISVAANSTSTASYLDTPSTGNGIYYYRVRATNSGGDSANTAVTAAGLWAAPTTPVSYVLRRDPANPANAQVLVNALSPVSVPLSLLTSLYLAASAGDDTLTVDATWGNPLPSGGVIYNGASHAAGDTLVLHGSGNASTVTLTAAQIALDGRSLTYSNVQSVTADSDLGAGTLPLVSVSGTTLHLSASQHLAGLALAANASVILTAGGSTFLELGSLTLAATATLDLNDHDLLVHTATLGTITDALHMGQLTSTIGGTGVWGLASTSGILYHSLNGPAALFANHAVSDTDVLVKYTYRGDATLDGRVTMDDYLQIDTGFLFGDVGYAWGDFDYSGQINATDYALIDTSFAAQGDSQAAALADLHASWFLDAYTQAVAKITALPATPPASPTPEISPSPAAPSVLTTTELPSQTASGSADNPSGGTSFTVYSTPNNMEFVSNFGDSGAVADPDYSPGGRSVHNIEKAFSLPIFMTRRAHWRGPKARGKMSDFLS